MKLTYKINKIQTNQWEVKIDGTVDGERLRKSKRVYGRKSDAKRMAEDLIVKIKEPSSHYDPDRMTLEDYLLIWIESRETNKSLAHSTWWRYKGIVEKKLNPALGHVLLKDLTPLRIRAYLDEDIRNGKLSTTTICQHYAVLRSALNDAVREYRLITANPALDVKPPRRADSEIKALSKEELQKVLSITKDTMIEVPVYIASVTGMRLSEILALRWSDVNYAERVININKTLHWYPDRPEWYTSKTKTKSGRRKVKISQHTLEYLRTIQMEHGRIGFGKDSFVCLSASGEPLRNHSVSNRFSKIMKRHGLGITFHGLRHTHATLLLADSNIPIKIVSDRLGHSSTSFTADVYIHPDVEHQTGAAEVMENILSGEPPITKSSKITRLSNYSQR